jgi:hypothetical protein
MAKVSEPAVTDDDIFFELERFEPSGGRLTLSGRWFGVRGRRFVRPTLTLAVAGERMRALADLDDKPWPAEDGQPWQASFPWSKTGTVEEPELSVASDITIPLPAPGARRARARRLPAQPRRAAMTASWGSRTTAVEAPVIEAEDETVLTVPKPDAAVLAPPELAEPEPDPAALQAENESLRVELSEARGASASAVGDLEALRAELSAKAAELSAVQAELAQTQRQAGLRDTDLEATREQLAEMLAARDTALRSGAQAEADRDAALSRVAKTEAQRDALANEKADLRGALEQRRAAVEALERQNADALASHGAALVMRGATQALPAYHHHVGWARRGLAVLLMLGIIFAVLIVLHVL